MFWNKYFSLLLLLTKKHIKKNSRVGLLCSYFTNIFCKMGWGFLAFFQVHPHSKRQHSVYYPFQYSFRLEFGMETALMALVEDLRRRDFDRGRVSLLILSGFQYTDRGIVLERLEGLEVSGPVLNWFHSFLSNRNQKVVLGDVSFPGSMPHTPWIRTLKCCLKDVQLRTASHIPV